MKFRIIEMDKELMNYVNKIIDDCVKNNLYIIMKQFENIDIQYNNNRFQFYENEVLIHGMSLFRFAESNFDLVKKMKPMKFKTKNKYIKGYNKN